jgi:hypothetical protein
LRGGKALERQARESDVPNRENGKRRRRVAEPILHRQQRAGRASRIVVAMMQIGPARFCMGNSTRLIARQCQRSAHDSQLADNDEENREQAPMPVGRSVEEVTAHHFRT